MGELASWRSEPSSEGAPAAAIACGPLRGVLLAADPSAGLRDLAFNNAPFAATLFAVTTPAGPLSPASESYTRGGDHVSTHPATVEFPFRTQLYWSAKPVAGGGVAATLSVSLQTDLLDTRPELTLATSLDKPRLSVSPSLSGDACRFVTPEATVVVAPHPSDAAECEASASAEGGVLRFSPPFLEKGVIRRLRVAAIVLPAGASDEAIEDAIADLADDPLPLTT